MASSSLGVALERLGVFVVRAEATSGDIMEVHGVVPKDKADEWGRLIHRALQIEHRARQIGSLEITRFYRVALKSQSLEAQPKFPGKGESPTLVPVRGLKLVWNWRVRADPRGQSSMLEACRQFSDQKRRFQVASNGNSFPLDNFNPSVPGITQAPLSRSDQSASDGERLSRGR